MMDDLWIPGRVICGSTLGVNRSYRSQKWPFKQLLFVMEDMALFYLILFYCVLLDKENCKLCVLYTFDISTNSAFIFWYAVGLNISKPVGHYLR